MRSKLVRIFAVIVTLTLIIQISLFMKSPIPSEFKDPENTASTLIMYESGLIGVATGFGL
jgi:hypothetical protein